MYEIFEELLKEKNVKVADVSRATGIKPTTFSEWKRGKYKPKDDKRQKIAEYFGVSLDYLDGKVTNTEITVKNYLDKQNAIFNVAAGQGRINDAYPTEFTTETPLP